MALKLKESGNDGKVKGSKEMNFLGEGTYVEGTIETTGSIRTDGKVQGAIKTDDTLYIGSHGIVSGEIQARMAVVGGKIEGNIKVDEKLVLEANSTLVGNLRTNKLVIDEGAVFQGKSDMGAETGAKKSAQSIPFQSKEKVMETSKEEKKGDTNPSQ